MKSTRQLIMLMTGIMLIFSAHAALALNDEQQKVSEAFFESTAKAICVLAHPTATYKTSEVTVSGNVVYLDITYYSEWLEVNKSIKLEISIGKNLLLNDIRVRHDDAFIPPFSALEILKTAFSEIMKEERASKKDNNQEKQDIIDRLGNYVANHLNEMNGEELCLCILNYVWIDNDVFKSMRMLEKAD